MVFSLLTEVLMVINIRLIKAVISEVVKLDEKSVLLSSKLEIRQDTLDAKQAICDLWKMPG